ncbi:MAG: nucleotidyl transferase AbiEii/AbiGii toxin family protein [Parcubacteria group bacterium]|nr:nucleotidyl transferase AbiEii/AbiGii toxin family protein [Parcubacteria group bacterium]
MHTEALTSNTKRVFESLGDAILTKNVYLAGGTALALYFGHRFSVDLDWFGQEFKFTEEFRRKLSSAGKLKIISQSEDTFHGQLDNVEVSFFCYPYKLLFSKKKYNQNLYLADEKDIACMKLDAIASRGSKKDFVDMYFLLHNFSLETLIDLMPKKFKVEYNITHLLKALTYFEDAERMPMPEMIKQVNWEEVKKFLISMAEQYMK